MERIEISAIEGLSAYKLSHIASHLVFERPSLRKDKHGKSVQHRPDKTKKAVLRALCDRYPCIWPGLRDIAAKASCSLAQARRVLRELEYKDRLIVDVNSRLQWCWPSGKDGRPALGWAVRGKKGGYPKSETIQYVVNDRRIYDIFEQQEFYKEWDKTHPINAHSSEDAPMPTHGERATDSGGVQNSVEGVTNKPDAHSYQHPDSRSPLIPELKQSMPTHGECRTYHLNLTEHLNLTSQGTVMRQAAETAALPEPNAAIAAEVKSPVDEKPEPSEEEANSLKPKSSPQQRREFDEHMRRIRSELGMPSEVTPMTDEEFEERKAFLRRQAEQLLALHGETVSASSANADWKRRKKSAMTLQDYFAMPDTPAAGSPVGTLMARIVERNPAIGFEAARAQANALLDRAAGKKVYRMPPILSVQEEQAQNERLRQRFRPVQEVLAAWLKAIASAFPAYGWHTIFLKRVWDKPRAVT
jgi:hypothetical protein